MTLSALLVVCAFLVGWRSGERRGWYRRGVYEHTARGDA
jgi:hypothetical protein